MDTLDLSNERKFLSDNTKAVVMFTASWCGPCKTLKPKFKALSESEQGAAFGMCDVEESGDLVRDLNIQGVPTVVAFHQGQEVGRSVGADEKGLKALVDDLVGR